jgi:N-acetylated-alpha-linked acidic dipeptidase
MIWSRAVLVAVASSLLSLAFSQEMLGFDKGSAARERDLEKRFDTFIHAQDQIVWLKRLSARPHHVGSAYGLSNAEYVRNLFKSWGFDAEIERFYVLFPSPKSRLLELVRPGHYRAKLIEPPVAGDATSSVREDQLPPYNAYSADGNVTAPLVYVNQGMPADYETLERYGINVKGKIVIARYGGGWRGIKPKFAAEHGAVGCIIYSDPRDDGYFQGDPYPNGPARNENGVQRGSIADMPIYPGDPLTPGVGATKGAKRLPISKARTIMSIPCLPISYADAKPLLSALAGPVAPETWRGALPLTYHIGPGPAKVHLAVKFNWDIVEARDVVAKLPGTDRADEWIIRGNHYDGWVFGANDPLSGAVALLSEAKAVGQLAKTGWRPRRTMVYCLWDGEEPGLLGSTEWVETHGPELAKHAALYINSDENGRGFFGAGGSHTLERFIGQVEQDVTDPETHVNLLARLKARAIVGGDETAATKAYLPLGALGSGSDFSPFLQHQGVASLNVGFGGEGVGGGQYHSTYDSFEYQTRFIDPGLSYGATLSKTAGRISLRAADADVLPFEFGTFTTTVAGYVDELQKLVDKMRKDTEAANRNIQSGDLALTYDPLKPQTIPAAKPPVPVVDFKALSSAVDKLKASTSAYEKAVGMLSSSAQARLDVLLIAAERSLLTGTGLPGRDWYKHSVYAPGKNTGYGVKTLPGIREAIEDRNWDEARTQIQIAARVLEAYAANVDEATKLRK